MVKIIKLVISIDVNIVILLLMLFSIIDLFMSFTIYLEMKTMLLSLKLQSPSHHCVSSAPSKFTIMDLQLSQLSAFLTQST